MSYRQTIKRHRQTLSMPILVCVIIAFWVVAGSPKQYESGATLWVDHAAPAPSSLTQTDTFVETTPAEQEMQIVTELLTTRDFRLAVARRGPLEAYLRSDPPSGWGPSAVLHVLRGQKPLDDRAVAALGPKSVTLEATGPQVLTITYRGGTPAVAAGTVKALVDEVNARLSAFAAQRMRTTVSVSKAAVDAASKAVADAQQRIDDYRAVNPDAGSDDPHFVALVKAERAAARGLTRATSKLNEVSSGGGDAASGTSFTVIDAPRQPIGPVTGMKRFIIAIIGGLFAGALISGLALLALTPSRPPAPEHRGLHAVDDDFDDEFLFEPARAGGEAK